MKEIRLHGRGGHGVVVSSEILVGAFLKEGKYAHAIPSFGVERRGAPVAAFVRFDAAPIWEKTQVYTPDCIVVTDPRLLKAVDAFAGVKDGALFVLNCRRFDHEGLPAKISSMGMVDATRIAMEVLGAPITSTCMLGALAAASGWIALEALLEAVEEMLAGKTGQANQRAVRRAFEETRVIRRLHGAS